MTPSRLAIAKTIAATRKHMANQAYALPKFGPLRRFIRGLVRLQLEENELAKLRRRV